MEVDDEEGIYDEEIYEEASDPAVNGDVVQYGGM